MSLDTTHFLDEIAKELRRMNYFLERILENIDVIGDKFEEELKDKEKKKHSKK